MTGPSDDLAAQIDDLFADVDLDAPPTLGALRPVEGGWVFDLDPQSAELTLLAATRFHQSLTAAAETSPEALRPQLYPADAAAEAGWQARADSSLADGRISAAATLIEGLQGATLNAEACLAAMRAVTDMRLRLYDAAGSPTSWTGAEEPVSLEHSLYLYFAYLSMNLLHAGTA